MWVWYLLFLEWPLRMSLGKHFNGLILNHCSWQWFWKFLHQDSLSLTTLCWDPLSFMTLKKHVILQSLRLSFLLCWGTTFWSVHWAPRSLDSGGFSSSVWQPTKNWVTTLSLGTTVLWKIKYFKIVWKSLQNFSLQNLVVVIQQKVGSKGVYIAKRTKMVHCL